MYSMYHMYHMYNMYVCISIYYIEVPPKERDLIRLMYFSIFFLQLLWAYVKICNTAGLPTKQIRETAEKQPMNKRRAYKRLGYDQPALGTQPIDISDSERFYSRPHPQGQHDIPQLGSSPIFTNALWTSFFPLKKTPGFLASPVLCLLGILKKQLFLDGFPFRWNSVGPNSQALTSTPGDMKMDIFPRGCYQIKLWLCIYNITYIVDVW